METDKVKRSRRRRKLLVTLIAIWGGLVLFLGGLYLGARASYPVKQRLTGTDTPAIYNNVDFGRFWEALGQIQDKFIGDIDYTKVVDGAISGMVSSLGDPFTTYFNTKDLEAFNSEINGTFEGIGAELTVRDAHLVIIAPLEGSPAERAGIKPGDVILLIDGQAADEMTVDEAISKIRGKKGTSVTLNILRDGKAFDIGVARDLINVKSANYKMLDSGIAYIRILRFDADTGKLFDQFAGQSIQDKAKGMILDLRNNPGGYLETADDVASEFIKSGAIVIEQYKDGRQDIINTSGKGRLFDIPLVVLVNKGSASGSEIVAGAIKDHQRGLLIGEKTFGKGSVQEMTALSSGGSIKITIAKWLTPNGTAIDKNGLLPDIEVKLEENSDISKDGQLDRAVEEVKKLIK